MSDPYRMGRARSGPAHPLFRAGCRGIVETRPDGVPTTGGDEQNPAVREEREVVTALFADVVGSTQLTERLDPEDARELLGGAVRREFYMQ